LVDTGFNNDVCLTALKKGLNELDADMENTDVFLTHFHADHNGLCGRIAARCTKIYMNEIDMRYQMHFQPENR
jgi:glyoxylase-like metal-dependent hydrolase (beta-lactamase superfamily II)